MTLVCSRSTKCQECCPHKGYHNPLFDEEENLCLKECHKEPRAKCGTKGVHGISLIRHIKKNRRDDDYE